MPLLRRPLLTRPFARSLAPLAACALPLIALLACEPRHKPVATAGATTAAPPPPTTTPTGPPPPPPPTATATAANPWGIPTTFSIPGLPASPRQAIIGKWNVATIDGRVVPAGGMGSDPMDPATYAAGSGVVFTATDVSLTRGGGTLFNRPYKVISEIPPVRVTIDAGYGPSNVDFALDGSCIWSLPTTPPHALSLTHAQ